MAENGRGEGLIYRTRENALVATAEATAADWAALDETTERHWKDIMADFVDQMLDVDRARTDHDVGELRRELAELKLKVAETSGAIGVLRTGKSLRVRGTFTRGRDTSKTTLLPLMVRRSLRARTIPAKNVPVMVGSF